MGSRSIRHLITLRDLADTDIRDIVDRGVALAQTPSGDRLRDTLADAVVGVYFTKTSTRTRTAFSSGALRLGAGLITYGARDLQTNTGESSEDTGRVLSRMLTALVARTAGDPAEMRAWAHQKRMAVVNAMSADEHPTQALADLTTLSQHFGDVDGLRILYVGEGNNTASALALALSRFRDVRLELRTPPGYGLSAELMDSVATRGRANGTLIQQRHDLKDLVSDIQAVYTTRWQTTGTTKADPNWRAVFAPFQVDEALVDELPGSIFMHDLPAHRGEEVTAGVLDGPASIAFTQAENKMFSAMAVLEWCHGVG
ncbi:ornithine carbamoyltransferase [Nonomuraea sp. NPDC052265]|uniref:ornithine carbamoyltransferase n=1 Tax=Nonomuraea sp. NPDC052265 TaxID=3364374 RepID=UPI0037CA495F